MSHGKSLQSFCLREPAEDSWDLREGLAGRWPCTEPGPLRTNHGVLTSSYQEPGLDPVLPICCLLLLFWQNKKPWKLQENKENLRNLTWKVLPVPESHREELPRGLPKLACRGHLSGVRTPAGPSGFQVEWCEPKDGGETSWGEAPVIYSTEESDTDAAPQVGVGDRQLLTGKDLSADLSSYRTQSTPLGAPGFPEGGDPWKGMPGLGAWRLMPGIPSGPGQLASRGPATGSSADPCRLTASSTSAVTQSLKAPTAPMASTG